jgi:hypothetical protein
MRANPFSTRPIEADGADGLVGRKQLMNDLGHHLRFGGPRLMILLGERGTGRTSVLHALSNFTPTVHHLSIFPEEKPAETLLNELYCLIAGYEVPGVMSTLVEQMVSALEGKSGDLPLISFDFPGTSGQDLAQVFERLTSVLLRLRALVIVALTPTQLSAWSENLQDCYHTTPSLSDFNAKDIQSLINARIRTVSNEKWAVSQNVIEETLASTGGRPTAVIRHLRDLIDTDRGVSTPLSRRQNALDSMEIEYSRPPPENDARQRMAPEISELTPLDVDDEPPEPEIEIKYELDNTIDSELEAEQEEEDWIDDEEEDEEEEEGDEFDWDVPQLDGAEEPPLPSLELDEPAPPDMNAAFGGAALQIEPGTEPPPVRSAFGGLKNRERSARIEQGLEKSLSQMPTNGEYNAKPDTSINIPMGEPNLESEESSYWIADEIDENPPEAPPPLEQPAMDPLSARTFGDTLRAQRTPELVASTFPLDIGRISNLNDGEIAIVEAATAREISPSDEALQAYLAVGRPRLSQIYNALQKSGILAVRKKGRTRLFRLSDSAKAHLSGGHMEA